VARGGDLDRARELWFDHPLFATTRRSATLAATLRATIATDTCRVWLDADRETPPPQPHVECLGELAMPVLLITGTDDLEDFRVIAEVVAALVADVRRVDVPGAGHLVHWERPDDTAAAITAFLTEPG
jgi:2-succinyl-6-hydroxy-2,4-cyclohexadiene-1-carboxylate synthase